MIFSIADETSLISLVLFELWTRIMVFSKVSYLAKTFFDQKPLVTNCLNYGIIAGFAEFTQQSIERKFGQKKSELQSQVSQLNWNKAHNCNL